MIVTPLPAFLLLTLHERIEETLGAEALVLWDEISERTMRVPSGTVTRSHYLVRCEASGITFYVLQLHGHWAVAWCGGRWITSERYLYDLYQWRDLCLSA